MAPCADELRTPPRLLRKPGIRLLLWAAVLEYSEAGEAIAAFCEKFNIPFAETQAGKSAIAGSNPYNLGGIGVTGNAAANRIAAKADLIIGVGTRFSDFTTSSKTLFRKATVVAVNPSKFHVEKLRSLPVGRTPKRASRRWRMRLKGINRRTGTR